MQLKFTLAIAAFLLLICCSKQSAAQQTPALPPQPDTIRIIQIIKANSLREKIIDSATTIETAAGNAVIKDGLTTIFCDSVVYNHRTKMVEAFGHVHINDNDSIHTYAQYLKYVGDERIAYLKKNVKLTDKKGVLLTDDLEYNLRTGIATYKGGGRVLNGKTVLTSNEGVYYADTKDVIFKKNVRLIDPKYDIKTDSMIYNVTNSIATFISPTHIVSKEGIIDTRSGTYDLKTGEAIFYERTYIRDSVRSMSGDKIFFDDKKGIMTADGNAKVVDSANQVTTIGGHIEVNTKENSFLAYLKPVMILHKDGDSTYIAADTLFSGLRKYDSVEKKQVTKVDTLKKTAVVTINKADSAGIKTAAQQKTDSIAIQQTVKTDSGKKTMVVNLNKPDTAIRYFLAFHHVRIFNDSLQAVSDSLYYSTQDSTFQLFGQPVVWNGQTQVTGDTIYMYTQNQKPKQVYVFFNSLIINKTAENLYNQIGGRTLNGYFKDGTIDYVRVKGTPAESVFYPQDDDSAYTGMNRSNGDVIDIFFVKKELNKVKFINNVDGVMYPIRQIPADKKLLKGFKWHDARRPKNKLELFE